MPRGQQKELHEQEVEIKRQSLKAVLCKLEDANGDMKEIWIPKSQIDNLDDVPQEGKCTLFITVWIANKLELV